MASNDRPALLVALGNTGARYEETRHNAGWLALDELTGRSHVGWQQKFKGLWARQTIGEQSVVVLKPQTMMNLSGESVQAAARFFRYKPGDIAVIHDDVELAFGEIGIRFGGGLAGHNGLRSVAHCLATNDFWRVRVGVGRPKRGELHGHVLGRFSPEEEARLPDVFRAVATLVERGYRDGFSGMPSKTAVVG